MNRHVSRSAVLGPSFGLLVALSVFGAGRLTLGLASAHTGVSPVWPAAGLAVGAVLLGGPRLLPAIGLGTLLTFLTAGYGVLPALIAAGGAVVQPWLAAVLLRAVGFREPLRRTSDVVAFSGLAAVFATAVGACFVTLAVLVAGRAGWGELGHAWRDAWLGGLSGVLIVGSAVLVLGEIPPRLVRSWAAAELVAMSAVVGVASFLLLDDRGSVPYLVLPLMFLLAMSYRQRGAVIGGLIVFGLAVALTAHGEGPFPGGSPIVELIRTQTFVCVGSVTALLVAAAQSERRLAERAVDRLAESESALAEAQRIAHIGAFETDLVSGRTIWSRELYRILGRSPVELAPSWGSWARCVHPDDVDELHAEWSKVREARGATTLMHRIVRPDGQVRMVETRLRFEVSGEGTPLRLVGTCQDVTAIRLAEQRFRSLFEDAPYSIVVIDAGGAVSLSNASAQQLFGYGADRLAGRPVEELVATPAGSAPWWEAAAHDGTQPDLELWGRRRDGATFPVEVSLTPLETEDGMQVSAAIRDVTMLRQAAEALTYQARHDSLTGLPNRLMFLERLDQALARARRSERPLAVVFLDLDDFKVVNDTRGHDAGDMLLTSVTARLGAAVRQGDTLARLGGDEFVVLCEDLADDAEALGIAQRLADAAQEPVAVTGYEHVVSISAGVVMVPDASGISAHAVLRDADAAMYAAKEGGKGRVAVFDDHLRERQIERAAIETALRGALDRRELTLRFQPVVDLERGRIVSVEALVRWQHPVRGLLAPREFLPVAERSGLSADIGEWVIEEACRAAAGWRDAEPTADPVPVSVNISPQQLTRSDVVSAVRHALAQTGLEPRLLELEVTESALLEDAGVAGRALERLKALGVRIVVDDFGTGYSSLSELRDLSIDGLKLDRSFVHRLAGEEGAGSMVSAVISMAGALDAEVTAEGVETWEQVSRLRGQGCDYAQGYLFARPVSADQVGRMITAERRRERTAAVS